MRHEWPVYHHVIAKRSRLLHREENHATNNPVTCPLAARCRLAIHTNRSGRGRLAAVARTQARWRLARNRHRRQVSRRRPAGDVESPHRRWLLRTRCSRRPRLRDGPPARRRRKTSAQEQARRSHQGPGYRFWRILCFSAKDGKELWKHEYDCSYSKIAYPSGPRATPVIENGRVYALGALGDLSCLEADSGKLQWTVNLPKHYATGWPVWGHAAHPLIVGDTLITLAGGKGSAVVALDKHTGKELWKALTTEEVGYAPPTLVKAGGRDQVVVWLSESLNGLDVASGEVFWSIPYPADGNPHAPSVNIMTPRLLDGLLFVSNFYHGPLVAKLDADKPDASVLWRGKSNNPAKPHGINPVMNTPIMADGYAYGICGMGELRCIDLKDGSTKWETLRAVGGKRNQFATAFFVKHEDRYFVFNELGELMIAKMTPKEFEVIDSASVIKATMPARGGRDVVWCHPAFAQRCMFVRNDEELLCLSLATG